MKKVIKSAIVLVSGVIAVASMSTLQLAHAGEKSIRGAGTRPPVVIHRQTGPRTNCCDEDTFARTYYIAKDGTIVWVDKD